MTSSSPIIDDLIRDYFQYRTLTSSTRVFEQEAEKSSNGRWRADRIVEQLKLFIKQLDLTGLIEYWTTIEQRISPIFSDFDRTNVEIFSKTRFHLYRCYLMHAVQTSKQEKINEFFDRLGKVLLQKNDWPKEWFTLPFIENPEENPFFRVYFSKQWNEVFWRSVENFLGLSIFQMSSPLISLFENDESSSTDFLIGSSSRSLPPSGQTILEKLRQLRDSTAK